MVTNNTGVDFDADVAFAVNDLGDSFTFGGTAYTSVNGPLRQGTKIETEAGYFVDVDMEIVVQTSLLPATRPVANDVITVGGVERRIVRVETDEADAALNLFIAEITG